MKLRLKNENDKKRWENMGKKFKKEKKISKINTQTHDYTQHLTKKLKGIKKNMQKKMLQKKKGNNKE